MLAKIVRFYPKGAAVCRTMFSASGSNSMNKRDRDEKKVWMIYQCKYLWWTNSWGAEIKRLRLCSICNVMVLEMTK